jgi:hypothetical protein
MPNTARPAWRSLPIVAWVLLLTGAILGPLARPGYALLRDMVVTPRQFLTDEAWGVGSALPRAVPIDAVMAIVTSVVDGAVVQRLALAGALVLAGLGAARLVPGGRLAALGAASLMIWNPYVAERLLLGHWSLLLGYAALPWVARAALDLRAGRSIALWEVVAWLALASLPPGGGVLAGLTAAPLLLWPSGSQRARQAAAVGLAWLLLNAPWWLPGVLHPSGGVSDPDGVTLFAARADTALGLLGSLLGLGAVWNGDAVPPSREEPPAAVFTLVLLALAVAGFPTLRRAWGRGADALLLSSVVGVLLALWGAWAPGSLSWIAATVPGGGLLRDGQRFVAPLAVLLAVSVPAGARALGRTLHDRHAELALGGAVVIAPVLVLPDLAWGAGGRIHPVAYPSSWQQVLDVLQREASGGGEVVSLPWQPLRQFSWNGARPVLDPAPRYLPVTVRTSSDLPVRTDDDGQVTVSGEDERATTIGEQLATGAPMTQTMPALGVEWVLVARDTPGEVPETLLAGAVPIVQRPDLELWRLSTGPEDLQATTRQAYWPVVLAVDMVSALLAMVAVVVSFLSRGRPARLRRRGRLLGRNAR